MAEEGHPGIPSGHSTTSTSFESINAENQRHLYVTEEKGSIFFYCYHFHASDFNCN